MLEGNEALLLRRVVLGLPAVDVEPESLERLHVGLGAGRVVLVFSYTEEDVALGPHEVRHPFIKLLTSLNDLLLLALPLDPDNRVPALLWLYR